MKGQACGAGRKSGRQGRHGKLLFGGRVRFGADPAAAVSA
ncbi:Hypothetical Protein RSKD131_4226 [Cereibacter sphaeroides KD131]|nr:Hypothetical Protein RSKD131_4226 [Cereibacter sphaeroides KD131]